MDLLKAARGQGPNALNYLNINARQAYNDLAAALKNAESEEAFLSSGAMEKYSKTLQDGSIAVQTECEQSNAKTQGVRNNYDAGAYKEKAKTNPPVGRPKITNEKEHHP